MAASSGIVVLAAVAPAIAWPASNKDKPAAKERDDEHETWSSPRSMYGAPPKSRRDRNRASHGRHANNSNRTADRQRSCGRTLPDVAL
jgi:hypothetical protein